MFILSLSSYTNKFLINNLLFSDHGFSSQVANEDHVKEAIRLFNTSTMDAARSGISQHINVTPEMANEIKVRLLATNTHINFSSYTSFQLRNLIVFIFFMDE